LKRAPVLVEAGQKTPLFSITNDAGGVFRGFLELLEPDPQVGTGDRQSSASLVTNASPNQPVWAFGQPNSPAAPADNASSEIAALNLDYAEKALEIARKKQAVGVIGELDLERAIAARDIAAAEVKGDAVEPSRIRLKVAEMEFKEAEARHALGVV